MEYPDFDEIAASKEWQDTSMKDKIGAFENFLQALGQDEPWLSIPVKEQEQIVGQIKHLLGIDQAMGVIEDKSLKGLGKRVIEEAGDIISNISESIQSASVSKDPQPINISETLRTKADVSFEDLIPYPETEELTPKEALKEATAPGTQILKNILHGAMATSYRIGGGFSEEMGNAFNNLGEIGDWVAEKLDQETKDWSYKGDPLTQPIQQAAKRMAPGFKEFGQLLIESAEWWHKESDKYDPGFWEKTIGDAVGKLIPWVAQFVYGHIPYATLVGAKDAAKQGNNEAMGALTGAAHRMLMGKVFHGLGLLKPSLRAPSTAAVFGIDAIANGASDEEVAEGLVMGLLYGMGAPRPKGQKGGPPYGAREILELNRLGKLPKLHIGEGTEPGKPGNNLLMAQDGQVYESHKSYSETLKEFNLERKKIKDVGRRDMDKGYPMWKLQKPGEGSEIWDYPEKPTPSPPKKAMASFLGWQETPKREHIALYNIESGPKKGTTVTVEGLKREGIGIPEPTTPKPGEPMLGPPEKPPKTYLDKRHEVRAEWARKAVKKHYDKNPTKQGMVKSLAAKVGIPIRHGLKGKRLGMYYPHERLIRMKKPAGKLDIPVQVHEVGHDISRTLNLEKLLREATKTEKELPTEVQNMAYEGAKNKTIEGIAEHLRMYVTHPEEAKFRAPKWTEVFEEAISRPENLWAKDIFHGLREQWQIFNALPLEQRLASYIKRPGEGKERKHITWEDSYRILFDAKAPIEYMVREYEKVVGKKPPPRLDPYLLSWGQRGVSGAADIWIAGGGQFDFDPVKGIIKIGPDLRTILKPVYKTGELERTDTYLAYKRILNSPKLLKAWTESGLEPIILKSDIEKYVNQIERESPRVVEVAKQVHEYANNLLTFLYKSGRISGKLHRRVLNESLFYVPLYEFMVDKNSPFTRSRGMADLRQPVKFLTGEGHEMLSPTAALAINTHVFHEIAWGQRAGDALRHVFEAPGMGKFGFKVDFPKKPTRVFPEKYEGELSLLREMAKEAGLDKDFINLLQKEFWQPVHKAKDTEIILYNRGKPELWEIGDPKLRDAILALDANTHNAFLEILALPAKGLRMGATMLSPEFAAIKNPIRDQMTAWLYNNYGLQIPGVDLVHGIFHMLGAKPEVYQKFKMAGALHATLTNVDAVYRKLNREQFLSRKKLALHLATHPWEGIRKLAELGETGTRVRAFEIAEKAMKKSIKEGEGGYEGWTQLDAMLAAGKEGRDITLDFQRLGGKAVRAMNKHTAFFGAQLGGIDKLRRQFRDHPGQTTSRIFYGIIAPTVALWYAQKDDPYYQEIPAWEKMLFWNIITHKDHDELLDEWEEGVKDGSISKAFDIWRLEPGRTFKNKYRISVPFEAGIIFKGMVEAILNYLYMNDPQDFKESLGQAGRAILPNVIPTLGTGVIEWYSEWNMFRDQPTVSRGKEGLEPWAQYSPYTSAVLRVLTKAFKDIPGVKGIASPAKINNLLLGWSGGGGRMALDAMDALVYKFGFLESTPEPFHEFWSPDTPLVRALVSRMPSANVKSITRFYKDYEEELRKWRTFTATEIGPGQAGLAGLGIQKPMPPKLMQLTGAAKLMSKLRVKYHVLYADRELSPKHKAKAMEETMWQMVNVARHALGKKMIGK